MSNKINAIIKLRIDSIENWTISNPILAENELVIVKLSEGKIGLKLGTGVEFNNTGFISFESLNVNSFNNNSSVIELPNESGTLATLLPLYSYFQVNKQFNVDQSHINITVSDSNKFDNILFELDSKSSPNNFSALNNGVWDTIKSSGFGTEYNNKPVLINLRDKLIDINLTPSTILYVNYYWYYIDDNGDIVKSNIYSTTLPANTEARVTGIITEQDIDARSLTLNGDLVVGKGLNGPITAITTSPGYTVMRLKDSSNDNYYHMYLDNGQLTIATETDSSAGDLSNVVDESSTSIITSVFGYSVIKWKDKADGSYYFMTLHDGNISINHTLPDILNSESNLINELNSQITELKSKVDRYESIISKISSLDKPSQSIDSIQSSINSILDAFKSL